MDQDRFYGRDFVNKVNNHEVSHRTGIIYWPDVVPRFFPQRINFVLITLRISGVKYHEMFSRSPQLTVCEKLKRKQP
jgi:hypothetical protein